MKFLLALLAVLVFGAASHFVFPWWAVVPATALVAAGVGFKSGKSFVLGFFGLALLWGGYATFLNFGNEGLLATRIGTLLQGFEPIELLGTTAVLGGMLGGLAGLTGSFARQLVEK